MEVNTVLNAITIVIISVFGFFVKRHLTDYDEQKKERIRFEEEATKEINNTKFNYLDRFALITQKLNDARQELTRSIVDSEKNLTKLIINHFNQNKSDT